MVVVVVVGGGTLLVYCIISPGFILFLRKDVFGIGIRIVGVRNCCCISSVI